MKQPSELRMIHHSYPLSGEALDALIEKQAEEGFTLTATHATTSGVDYYFAKAGL